MRCYRYNQIGNWAKECRYSWVTASPSHTYSTAGYAGKNSPHCKRIFHQRKAVRVFGKQCSIRSRSDVTEFEDLAEVLRNNDLFECETHSNLPLLVKGKLRRNLGFWERIGTDRLILVVIKFGCKLPFSDLPVPVELKNNKSALSHAPFEDEALADLHKTGRVVQCQEPPLVVNSLSVAVQAGGGKEANFGLKARQQIFAKEAR